MREINQPLLASPTDPVNGITTNTVANAAQRLPYVGFAPTGLSQIETYGFSMYNGLQLTLKHIMAHGVRFQAAYTWSKAMTDVTGLGFDNVYTGGFSNSNDVYNRHQRWGPLTSIASSVWRSIIPGTCLTRVPDTAG